MGTKQSTAKKHSNPLKTHHRHPHSKHAHKKSFNVHHLMTSKPQKYAYFFGEGDTKDKYLLGGKGAGLGTMTKIGLPVPKGFTISTQACTAYTKEVTETGKLSSDSAFIVQLRKEITDMVTRLEKETKKKFGKTGSHKGDQHLLLLSVRSGAAISMPGMMDTVLNLGLNDESVATFAREMNNEHFAWDSYRRFIQMYGDVVMGVSHDLFEDALDKLKTEHNLPDDTAMTVPHLQGLVSKYKLIIEKEKGESFPSDPWEQLWRAVLAVFASWNNERAITYRALNGISSSLGTAVNVQSMVFGNFDDNSGTGVAFTRSPTTGENELYGEYLVNAQGEDVVAGVRTPNPIAEMKKQWPELYDQLSSHFSALEKHYRDMQDTEFTIERGTLYMLQTRTGKRTAAAAVKIAVEMFQSGMMTKDEALLSIDPNHINDLLHPTIVPKAKKTAKLIGKGLPASPGAGVGQVVFTAARAIEVHNQGHAVVLVRLETSPEDISGMNVAQGVLTARGGMTSHAAVVARGMGKCCVAGCSDLEFHVGHHDKVTECKIGGHVVKEGDHISLDGSTGEVFKHKVAVAEPKIEGDYATVMKWADERRTLGVRTNADTPKDAAKALEFGAHGIGLTRTEHMFFLPERITPMREMILAKNTKARKKALGKLLPFQVGDFKGIFRAMDKMPVIIRLLDPPLHEFLPHTEKGQKEVAHALGMHTKEVATKVAALHETNPMLGFRGCRLSVVYPEITEMQIKAIFEAALLAAKEGITALPEIEVPLVGNLKEFLPVKFLIQKIAKDIDPEGTIKFKIGTMIEVPRAALIADQLAQECDFMSFGTNDLTQTTCAFSRDDAGSFLKEYVRHGIYNRDPFASLDQEGVGRMMKLCVAMARSAKPDIPIGICGEHGGDKDSVEFCHRIGLNDVSCSPYRVPVARLAAAQAAIRYGDRPKTLTLEDVMAE